MLKSVKTPIPDPHSSFTHSCNNLASYEVKKNPNAQKKKVTTQGADISQVSISSTMQFVRKKEAYETKKDYGQSLQELKQYSKPNLDDGNRFFDDTTALYASFSKQTLQNQEEKKKRGFTPKTQGKAPAFVPVTHDQSFGQRSYISLAYTPKRYATKPQPELVAKYKKLKEEEDRLRALKEQEASSKKLKVLREERQRRLVQEATQRVKLVDERPKSRSPPQKSQTFQEKQAQTLTADAIKQFEQTGPTPPPSAPATNVAVKEEISEPSSRDPRVHWQQFPLEGDHPYSYQDPRNQFVQYNLKYKEPQHQKVKPYYNTSYKRSYSPTNTVKTINQRKTILMNPYPQSQASGTLLQTAPAAIPTEPPGALAQTQQTAETMVAQYPSREPQTKAGTVTLQEPPAVEQEVKKQQSVDMSQTAQTAQVVRVDPMIYEKAQSIASRGQRPYSTQYLDGLVPGIILSQKEKRTQLTDPIVISGPPVGEQTVHQNKATMPVAGTYSRRMEMPKFWQDGDSKPMYTIYLKKTDEQAQQEEISRQWDDSKRKITGKVGWE